MDDRQIVELYLQRDEKAIEETSKKYGAYCYGIAHNILQNRQDSEECVNDTWLKTWNSIPPQHPNSLKLFLAKITRNLSFDRYRASRRDKRGGRAMEVALDEIEEIVAGTSDVVREAEARELIRSVERFLYGLPSRERAIFIRRYFYFDSIARISSTYCLKENNVLRILSRTRAKLKKFLEEEGHTV